MNAQLPSSCNTLIVGGGVVGLSLAYELGRRGCEVVVIDRQEPGKEASWAGAGILPPGSWYERHPALEQLAELSAKLNARWAEELAEVTGIDNEYRRMGGIYLATDRDGLVALEGRLTRWNERGVETTRLSTAQLRELEPALADLVVEGGSGHAAYFVPGEAQLDNRRHIEALLAGCKENGCRVVAPAKLKTIDVTRGRVQAIITNDSRLAVENIVLAAGARSSQVAELLGVRLPVKPIRGQIVQFGPDDVPKVGHNLHLEGRYIVPRRNGRLIVGSTVDDVGFDKSNVPRDSQALVKFAVQLLPELAGKSLSDQWAGLRPASADDLPYIGRLAEFENAYVATGHFRAGLQLASGTAVALADVLTGAPPSIDLQPFRPDR